MTITAALARPHNNKDRIRTSALQRSRHITRAEKGHRLRGGLGVQADSEHNLAAETEGRHTMKSDHDAKHF
jgi:hypothetical protein